MKYLHMNFNNQMKKDIFKYKSNNKIIQVQKILKMLDIV